MTKAVAFLFVVSFFAHLLFGCATIGTVTKGACSPVTSEVATIVAAFAPADYQTQIGKLIAGGTELCKVQAAVDQETGGQALLKAGDKPLDPVTLDHMHTWRAANP